MEYKERFSKALKDVTERLINLPESEFKILLDKHRNTDKTNALLYAWDYNSPELREMEYMKSKKKEVAVVHTVWDKGLTVCQCCKSHRNKPSRCITLKKSVGRKQDASSCESFGRKKK